MGRPTPGRLCTVRGCGNYQPCDEHKPTAWRDSNQRRPQALTGRRLKARNQAVLNAHAGICHICNTPGATQVDHVIPYSEGGTDHPDNLRPIHAEPCHTDKTRAEALRGRKRATDNTNVDWAE